MNRLKRFFSGRYGVDQLSITLLFLYIAIAIPSQILRVFPAYLLSYSLFGYAFFRILSRSHAKRATENTRFLYGCTILKNQMQRMRDSAKYRYFKCPHCGLAVRVPRGCGRVNISCPKCGGKFFRKV